MKKSRAIFLLIALVVVIVGYVAWAAWEPAPTLQSMEFDKNVRAHPPKVRELTWQRFLKRLVSPYEPRRRPSIYVGMVSGDFVAIDYPLGSTVFLVRNQIDGSWSRYERPARYD